MGETTLARPRARVRALPTTRRGRIACWMALAAATWFAANTLLLQGVERMEGIPRTPLIVSSLLGMGLAFSGGVVAALAIARDRERGWLVFAASLPAAALLVFLAGELLVPH